MIVLITNRLNGKQYVGITTKTTGQHFFEHVTAANKGFKTLLHVAIRKHGAESFLIKQIDEASTLEELKSKEIYWIETLGIFSQEYNATKGGDGLFGYRHTDEVRASMSANRSGEKNHNFGKSWGRTRPLTEEAKKKLSIALTCKKHTEETKALISAATSLHKRKSVSCYSKNGDFLATYPSLIEAALAVSGHKNKISECLCGHRKTHKGFIWKYLNDSSERH